MGLLNTVFVPAFTKTTVFTSTTGKEAVCSLKLNCHERSAFQVSVVPQAGTTMKTLSASPTTLLSPTQSTDLADVNPEYPTRPIAYLSDDFVVWPQKFTVNAGSSYTTTAGKFWVSIDPNSTPYYTLWEVVNDRAYKFDDPTIDNTKTAYTVADSAWFNNDCALAYDIDLQDMQVIKPDTTSAYNLNFTGSDSSITNGDTSSSTTRTFLATILQSNTIFHYGFSSTFALKRAAYNNANDGTDTNADVISAGTYNSTYRYCISQATATSSDFALLLWMPDNQTIHYLFQGTTTQISSTNLPTDVPILRLFYDASLDAGLGSFHALFEDGSIWSQTTYDTGTWAQRNSSKPALGTPVVTEMPPSTHAPFRSEKIRQVDYQAQDPTPIDIFFSSVPFPSYDSVFLYDELAPKTNDPTVAPTTFVASDFVDMSTGFPLHQGFIGIDSGTEITGISVGNGDKIDVYAETDCYVVVSGLEK